VTRRAAIFTGTALGVLIVCQIVGYLVQERFAPYESVAVTDFLRLTYLRNTGAIFGLLPGTNPWLALSSSLIIIGLCLHLMRRHLHATWQFACIGCIAGAAASNVCDRLVYGAVIDYIDVQGIPYWTYVFNLADMAIHVGAWPLAFAGLRGPRDAAPRSPASLDP
jgi:signal peptidase II